MIKAPLSASALLGAALFLTACQKEEPTVVGGVPDSQARELAEAPPVALPPSVTASLAYRCSDNSLVYVDFLSDNSANVRLDKAGDPKHLTAPEAGKPVVADGGWAVDGTGKQVKISVPGKSSQTCKA